MLDVLRKEEGHDDAEQRVDVICVFIPRSFSFASRSGASFSSSSYWDYYRWITLLVWGDIPNVCCIQVASYPEDIHERRVFPCTSPLSN
jgi:hypothetical protein